MTIRKNLAETARKLSSSLPPSRLRTSLTYEGKLQTYLWSTGKGRAKPVVKH